MTDGRDRSDEDTDEHPVVGFGQRAAHERPDTAQPPQPPQWQPPPAPQPPQWQPPQPRQWQPPQMPQLQQPPWQPPAAAGSWPQQAPYWQFPRYGTSGLAIAGAIALIVLGVLLTLLFGVALVVFDVAMEFDPEVALEPAEAQAVKLVIGAIVVLSILQIVAGIGALAHREWARIIGIVFAVLGTLVGTLGMIGALVDPVDRDPVGLVLVLLFLGGYAVALFGLIAGGAHFRRYY